MDKLFEYRKKRSAEKTPEPFTSKDKDLKKLLFVVQKHRATALHWDFRLQVGSVMPSWAVPKGPSLDPGVRRLAMKTEDHPLDYRNFEGEIPKGQYGAGQVIIWDEGTYFPEIEAEKGQRVKVEEVDLWEKLMERGIKGGEIKFFLFGKRLKGSFALVKTQGFGGRDNSWLLIKHRDKFAKEGYDAKEFNRSVRSKLILD